MTTTRLVEWFEREAAGYLAALERGADTLDRDAGALDDLRANARALGGAARLAGNDRVHRAAEILERGLAATEATPETAHGLAEDVRATADDLAFLLDAEGAAEPRDARVDSVAARWADAGSAPAPASRPVELETFHAFVTREAAGIADVMDRGVAAFGEDPTNREWLGAILRRQRTLLGSARLDDVPVLAEALGAVEDLCELIVRLDVPVKSEWMDVFRSARDVVRAAGSALEEGGEPVQTPALSRLRTLREELVARYGERVAAQSVEAAAEPGRDGEADAPPPDPRQRAAVLRAEIAYALGDQTGARQALDELYGLLLSALR